jgi:predicted dehydrogenase
MARSANEKVNVAVVGLNGYGRNLANQVNGLGHNVAALCDVDSAAFGRVAEGFPKARRYQDVRSLLEHKDVDAVMVATPDHWHALISVWAMQAGKDVWCEKPMAHNVAELSVMREAARRYKRVTQVGTQGVAEPGFRKAVELVQGGAIGAVREVHVWTNRPVWPQATARPPEATPPNTLNWDLWLGPAAVVPYTGEYHPFKWRAWAEFGTGALGDMGPHSLNVPFRALDLNAPVTVAPEAEPFNAGLGFPKSCRVVFQFPARGSKPPVTLTWYDGGRLPPPGVLPGQQIKGVGIALVGEKGTLLTDSNYGTVWRLLRGGAVENVSAGTGPTNGLLRNWFDAIVSRGPTLAGFDGIGLTQAVLLGNVALRLGRPIGWDAAAQKATVLDGSPPVRPEPPGAKPEPKANPEAKKSPPAEVSTGQKYALLVGVQQYDKNELRDLRFPEADVEGLARVLRADGYKRVVLMTVQEGAKNGARSLPLAANIRKELKGLLEDREETDSVVVAFAGHSVQFRDSDEHYFCPMDAKLTDRRTLVSLTEVYKELEKCPSNFKLLLVDACRNDPQAANSRARAEVDLQSVTRPQKKLPPGGLAAFFSCAAGEKAFESDRLRHGVFFHYVIEGLGGKADFNRDGQVDLDELALFVRRNVPDHVKEEFSADSRQMPELVGKTRGVVPLVRLAAAAPEPPSRVPDAPPVHPGGRPGLELDSLLRRQYRRGFELPKVV